MRTMPVRDILRLCVLLHISSSFHKFAECALVIKPQDVVAFTGEVFKFNCSSSASKRGNIAWSVGESTNYIYALDELSPNVTSYINVTDRDDGNCSLTINASFEAANKYICRELDTGNEASAELTVMENPGKCTREVMDLSLHVSCSIVSAGKWAPAVVCDQVIEGNKPTLLPANGPPKLDNISNVVTSTWNFNSKKDSCNTNVTCRTKFNHHGITTQTIATYCTPCRFEKAGFSSSRRFLNIDEIKLWSDPNYNGCLNQAFRHLLEGFNMDLHCFAGICYSVSVLALLLTLCAYLFTWKQSGSAQTVFLINLCVALIIAYSFCMAGIYHPNDVKVGCKVIILVLQYFVLAAFSILLAEGCRLLIYISSGFLNRRRRKETIALLAAAWGLPIIIVVVSFKSSKVENGDSDLVCWLLLEQSFILAFAVPVLVFILAHVIISTIVLKCLSRNVSILGFTVETRNQIRATLWNMLVTCPVFFFGCLFGALSIFYSSALFLHLFVLINSLEGLLIFIFHVLCNIQGVNDWFPCIHLNSNSKSNHDDKTKLAERPAKKTLVTYLFGPTRDNLRGTETQPTIVYASEKLASIDGIDDDGREI